MTQFSSTESSTTTTGTSPNSARRKAAHRKRRLILNNDGQDLYRKSQGVAGENPALKNHSGPVTPELFLESRTAPLKDSQVDAIFYCTGVVNLYTHRSAETEFEGDVPGYEFARDLVEQGTDPLELMVDFGHRNDIEVFWSMRMNDVHDYADKPHFSRWKAEHPEYLMGQPGDKIPWREEDNWSARWSALDYGQPEVREKIFRILQDVCTRYDVDGIELDFFRHPLYFRPQYVGEPVTQEYCDLMTDLLRRVRAMTEEVAAERGRPLLIAARVPDSLGYSKAIGLDIETWLQEDLVDLLTGSCYFQLEPWENFAALGKRFDVPVYACLSGSRFVDPDNTRNKLPRESWYGEALSAWDAGVSGIYIFNISDPHDKRLRELGDPTLLRSKRPHHKFITGSRWRPDYWLKGGSRFCQWPEV